MTKSDTNKKQMPEWDLRLLYESVDDPKIESDLVDLEKKTIEFAKKYTQKKDYLNNSDSLLEALTDYENMIVKANPKGILYLFYTTDLDASNITANAKMALMQNRLAKSQNEVTFFIVSLSKIPKEKQDEFVADPKLAHYRLFLGRLFEDAKHILSTAEEKIINLKNQPAHEMWVSGTERILNKKTVLWKGKKLPFAEATNEVHNQKNPTTRYAMHRAVTKTLSEVAPFAELEINAIYTDKKIEDDLRGFKTSSEATVKGNRNDPEVINKLVDVVTKNFELSRRFYVLKAKILKLKKLKYPDRGAKIGTIGTKFPFDNSLSLLQDYFGSIDHKYSDILEKFVKNGQVDVAPKVGKTSGAYCSSSYENPTFVLLNHTDDFHSFTTFAHEIGHAFHFEASKKQGPMYCDFSTSLAETASTLFETIAKDKIIESLSKDEQIVALHDKLNDEVSTIFRQIACFNFEKDLHDKIREKGYLDLKEIGELHNKNMLSYLGPLFELEESDGNMFVYWSHIRRFFYVYTYAYGMLASKAMLRKFKQDKSFWNNIEKFLESGSRASPEEILSDIGLDLKDGKIFEEGLKEIEEDIKKLEMLVNI